MGCFGQELVTDQQVLDTIQEMVTHTFKTWGGPVGNSRVIFPGSLEVSFMVVSPGRVCGLKTVSPAVGQYS